MKCRNPANLFTIAKFHYREGSRGPKNSGVRKKIAVSGVLYIPFQWPLDLPVASTYITGDHHTEPGIIPMSEHVSECISTGITSSAGVENDPESRFEVDIASRPPPLISSSTALIVL